MPTASKYELRISNYAFFNLREIYQYISHIDFRPSVASEVVLAIENKIIRDIACFPFYFPECPARKTRGKIYRQALCKNYKIIFKIDRETISIIGIVHSSRSRSFIKRIPSKSWFKKNFYISLLIYFPSFSPSYSAFIPKPISQKSGNTYGLLYWLQVLFL